MKKKIIGLIVFSILLVLSISLIILLTNNKTVYTYDETITSNIFEYEQPITSESIESKYFYSDSYFKESSESENEHLRTFALSLSLAFNPTNRKDEVTYNLDKMLGELNFNDVEYYDLDKFDIDTMGTSISHKKLNEKYDLVLIVLRGAGYGDEWLSNLDLGESGNAKGFDDSSFLVLSRLKDYLKDKKIDDYKLLVAGYSRAGAVSGLVGVHINNSLKEYGIDNDDLYVYTFESPRYAESKKIYNNIHNVINKNDIVTYVYPESWGLYYSGVDEDITTEKKELQEKYLDLFASEKIKDLETVDIQRFIKMFINLLPKDRNSYYEISDSISNIYKLFSNKSLNEKNKIINFLKNIKIEFNLSSSMTLLTLINSDDKSAVRKAYNEIISIYDKEYSTISNIITDKEYKDLKDDIFDIFMFLQPSIRSDYKGKNMFSTILTFAYNTDSIFEEHYFDINFDQVQKKDSYYNEIPN